MQIVINISDEMYRTVQDGTYCGSLYEELKNGTQLPKGHGRIENIDDEMLAMASQDRPILRDELGIQTPSTSDGLQVLSEGFDFLQFKNKDRGK